MGNRWIWALNWDKDIFKNKLLCFNINAKSMGNEQQYHPFIHHLMLSLCQFKSLRLFSCNNCQISKFINVNIEKCIEHLSFPDTFLYIFCSYTFLTPFTSWLTKTLDRTVFVNGYSTQKNVMHWRELTQYIGAPCKIRSDW